jgi:hypothetical protein
MTSSSPVQVLIFEDQPGQIKQIADWLGLASSQYTYSSEFVKAVSDKPHPDQDLKRGWKWVQSETRRVDPQVVIFDYLLAKEDGNEGFDGLVYGNWCKGDGFWPKLGVVVVTSGRVVITADGQIVTTGDDKDKEVIDYVRSQAELDRLHLEKGWPIDFFWLKPRGTAETSMPHTKAKTALDDLISRSHRPSEHQRASS